MGNEDQVERADMEQPSESQFSQLAPETKRWVVRVTLAGIATVFLAMGFAQIERQFRELGTLLVFIGLFALSLAAVRIWEWGIRELKRPIEGTKTGTEG